MVHGSQCGSNEKASVRRASVEQTFSFIAADICAGVERTTKWQRGEESGSFPTVRVVVWSFVLVRRPQRLDSKKLNNQDVA